MKTYTANVTVDEGWLMIHVPELDLLTQAEHWGEVEAMARDIIALELDIEVEDVQVELRPDASAQLRRAQETELGGPPHSNEV